MSPFDNKEEKGRPISILDEGVSIATNVGTIDFEGGGVTGAAIGTDVTETVPLGGGVTSVTGETPSGTINGSNKDFVAANTPTSGTMRVYKGGTRRTLTEDYTISSATVTFLVAPRTGSIIRFDYEY